MSTRELLLAIPDEWISDACQQHLEQAGYEIQTAKDALECWDWLQLRTPAAVVLGQGLLWGGVKGVLERLRSDSYRRMLPAIVIADEGADSGAERYPADHSTIYLQTPLQMSDLSRCVQRVLERQQQLSRRTALRSC